MTDDATSKSQSSIPNQTTVRRNGGQMSQCSRCGENDPLPGISKCLDCVTELLESVNQEETDE